MRRLIGSKLNTEALNRLVQQDPQRTARPRRHIQAARGGDPGSVQGSAGSGSRPGQVSIFPFPSSPTTPARAGPPSAKPPPRSAPNASPSALLSDRDSSIEQMAGIQARYNACRWRTDRVRLGFEFDAYHDQYDPPRWPLSMPSTKPSSLGAGAYRSRLNFEPSATFVLAKPLTLTVGMSFEQLQPEVSAAPIGIGQRGGKYSALSPALGRFRMPPPRSWMQATTCARPPNFSASDLAYTRHRVNAALHSTRTIAVRGSGTVLRA